MICYHNKTEWFKDFDSAYVNMMRLLLTHGQIVTPRPGSSLGATKEVLNACFAIPATMPMCTIAERKMSYAFAMLEPFFLFTTQGESDIVGALSTYAPNLVNLAYNDKTEEFDGNYGDRIHLRNPTEVQDEGKISEGQLMRCYELLRQDPMSRRAILTIHNPLWDVINGDSKDIPCTLNLQFIIRDGKLHCFCNMRSNDIWYGTPHNVMMFTFLQRAMANWLGVIPGDYVHRANSLHMYEKHWEKASNIVESLRDPGFYRDDIPREVLYPAHCSPDITYRQARRMIAHEKALRNKHDMKWQLDDVYEKRTSDFIEKWLERPNNDSK